MTSKGDINWGENQLTTGSGNGRAENGRPGNEEPGTRGSRIKRAGSDWPGGGGGDNWPENEEAGRRLPRVAYFCMEYGLNSNFQIYAGGLGILAGDYLKAARDLGLAVVGVGILWKQGYSRQVMFEGQPVDSYPVYRYEFLQDTGITVPVRIRNRKVLCRVWKVDCFHNAPLYLLDTDLPENEDPWITGQLYGWFPEERVAQEMVLGIGGIRALRELGIEIDLYHFNEGHAVFAGLEMIREGMEKGLSFEQTWEEVREKIVFTTHTPVIQGNEEHPLSLLQYLGADLGFSLGELIDIGGCPFNMTVAGLRLSRKSNGVSHLHSRTARRMWSGFSNCSEIIGITNGIHRPSWVSREIINSSQDGQALFQTHLKLKGELLEFIKRKTGQELKLESLLVGFARRAAPYKRGGFIFAEEERIAPLLEAGRLQLIFAGKAHPLDDEGKGIAARQYELAGKYTGSVVFLENYDMETAAYLTRGCDLWLNNPRRPKEACGTSGMKAAMNGVLNLSILDGWWPEVCRSGSNGWQIGDGLTAEDFSGSPGERVKKQDIHDLASLYKVLFSEVIPTYYEDRGKWQQMMRASIEETFERFSARRMLQSYYEQLYSK